MRPRAGFVLLVFVVSCSLSLLRDAVDLFASPYVACRLSTRRGHRCEVGRACSSGVVASSEESWAALQAEVEDAKKGVAGAACEEDLSDRAAGLLVTHTLNRLREWMSPAETLRDIVLEGDPVAALRGVLGDEARFVTDSLSDSADMSIAHEAFFQAEMYLKRVQPMQDALPTTQPSQPSVREVQSEMQEELMQVQGMSPEMSDALDNSLLVARMNFHTTVRFGYFIQRCKRRTGLERILRGVVPSVEEFLTGMEPADVVELTRAVSKEAAAAMDLRTSMLFGDFRTLLKQMGSRPDDLTMLDMSPADATRLTIEAAAFGAALFEAEEEASRHYEVHDTRYGSRDDPP